MGLVIIAIIFISFLAGLTLYIYQDTKGYLRLFPLFLLLSGIIEIIAFYLLTRRTPPVTLYNLFIPFEFLFYFYILREIIQNTRVKRIIFSVSWLFLLLVILNFLFIQKIADFKSITYALVCLLIVASCIYYFYAVFQLPHSVKLVRQPAFWICSGLLFYYTCSFPIYGLTNFVKKAPPVILKNIGVIIFLLNVFLYSSFTIAFLCRLRTRKSIS
jgi:hypothetical protein